MRKYLWLGLLACCLLWACRQKVEPVTVSPDGNVWVEVSVDSLGCPQLEMRTDGNQMMQVEHIGLRVREDFNLSQGFLIRTSQAGHCDSVWLRPWGENKEVRENYNAHTYYLTNKEGVEMWLEVKAFDDGAAFQYSLYAGDTALTLLDETTLWHFPEEGTSWSIAANFESYELPYREQLLSQTEDANTPFTFRLANGLWGSIHEAGLKEMPEMTLRRADSLRMGVWLCLDNSGSGSSAKVRDTIRMAVRTLQIGRKAVDLINSNLIENCNRPSRLGDCGWLVPMKYIGVWWGMHLGINTWTPDARHGATTEEAERYVDFAAAHHIDAVLLEGWNLGWEQWGGSQVFDFTHAAPDLDIEKVIAYAHDKGVEIVIHHETGGNIPHYEKEMEAAFAWCEQHGIHYVKTGYAGGFPDRELHHSQYGVTHYAKVVECAARHGVMLDVHEPIKPTGLCREYPNLMTGEGARGMEWNAWSDGNPPSHETLLPFTRLLAGAMDYTPGVFDITYECLKKHPEARRWNQKDPRKCRVRSTLAHQVALWVVIYSPWQMACDLIEHYEGHPMFRFFEEYDPDCEWSRALDGEPGRYIITARKAGGNYYVGGVTNEEERTVEVGMEFLPEGEYQLTLYADGLTADYETNPTAWQICQQKVTQKDKVSVRMARGGGFAMTIRKI